MWKKYCLHRRRADSPNRRDIRFIKFLALCSRQLPAITAKMSGFSYQMMRLKKWFLREPYHAWPIVFYTFGAVWMAGRYFLIERHRDNFAYYKYRDDYTIIRKERLKDPDKPYFN